ncbi:hypothetical protein AKJ16_DCAP14805 [Drosera capensis]
MRQDQPFLAGLLLDPHMRFCIPVLVEVACHVICAANAALIARNREMRTSTFEELPANGLSSTGDMEIPVIQMMVYNKRAMAYNKRASTTVPVRRMSRMLLLFSMINQEFLQSPLHYASSVDSHWLTLHFSDRSLPWLRAPSSSDDPFCSFFRLMGAVEREMTDV